MKSVYCALIWMLIPAEAALAQPIDLVNGPKGAVAQRVEAQAATPKDPNSAPQSPCTEVPTPPRAVRRFNLERAYPESAFRRGLTGEVQLVVKVDELGGIADVIVVSAQPLGVFEDSVVQEARRMTFSPARRNCMNVAGDFETQIRFMLGD